MKNREAIIFDMDGVLIDSEPIHYEIEKIIFNLLGITVPDELHRNYMGASNDFMYADLKLKFGLSAPLAKLIEFDDQFRSKYLRELDRVDLNEGVLSLLKELKATGLKLAVATSSSPEVVSVLLSRCMIATYFDAIVTTTEAGKSKPAPEVYLLAAQKIDVDPSKCIVFEDSPNGLLAAKRAGMYCVVIQNDNRMDDQLQIADHRIRSFSEMKIDQFASIFP